MAEFKDLHLKAQKEILDDADVNKSIVLDTFDTVEQLVKANTHLKRKKKMHRYQVQVSHDVIEYMATELNKYNREVVKDRWVNLLSFMENDTFEWNMNICYMGFDDVRHDDGSLEDSVLQIFDGGGRIHAANEFMKKHKEIKYLPVNICLNTKSAFRAYFDQQKTRTPYEAVQLASGFFKETSLVAPRSIPKYHRNQYGNFSHKTLKSIIKGVGKNSTIPTLIQYRKDLNISSNDSQIRMSKWIENFQHNTDTIGIQAMLKTFDMRGEMYWKEAKTERYIAKAPAVVRDALTLVLFHHNMMAEKRKPNNAAFVERSIERFAVMTEEFVMLDDSKATELPRMIKAFIDSYNEFIEIHDLSFTMNKLTPPKIPGQVTYQLLLKELFDMIDGYANGESVSSRDFKDVFYAYTNSWKRSKVGYRVTPELYSKTKGIRNKLLAAK